MGSEQLPINESQEMGQKTEEKVGTLGRRKAEEETENVGGEREKVVYKGQYVVMVDRGRLGLVVYPREVPKDGKKEYLLRMMDELLAVHDEIFKGGKRRTIDVGAVLKHGGVRYELAVFTDGSVDIAPLVDDYEDFIRGADKVEMWTTSRQMLRLISRSTGRVFKVWYWRYAIAIENGRDTLHAAGRMGMRLRGAELMLAIIKEALDRFKDSKVPQGVNYVLLHGLVWRNNAGFFPAVYRDLKVDFIRAKGDYADFVRGAEGVEFV